MFSKVISTTLTISAIALSTTALATTESYSQQPSESKMTFVCASQTEPPTMYGHTPGKVNLTPLISWYQDYLLPNQSAAEVCQQVAAKLQSQYQQGQKKFFTTEQRENQTVVCLVSQENQTCSSNNSEELFSVNPNYDATCVLDNRQPLECMAIGRTRGVSSIPDSPYMPTWWPWW
jgi:hypothetical protein